MLAEDVVITMPPMATWYDGRDAARVFLERFAFARRWSREHDVFEEGVRDVRLVRTSANGQPALAAYNRDPEDGLMKPYALQVLTIRDGRVAQVDGFVTPSHFPVFGLPDVLDEAPGGR
jgi:RNA polymerase sigma-70 factor (ECF subfamily)